MAVPPDLAASSTSPLSPSWIPRVAGLTDGISGAPVSGASRRLRALAALSGSLTDPLAPEEAAAVVERQALTALGATSAVVVTLGEFPTSVPAFASAEIRKQEEPATPKTLHVVHAIGLAAEVHAALDQVSLDAEVPFAEVARVGEALFLASETELLRYPGWGDAMVRAGAQAAAIVPVWANGELRGVLGLSWALPRDFDEDERAFVLTLGVMCAQAIMRAHLRAAEGNARREAEEANQSKAHFVATISHELRTPINAVLGYTELLTDEIYGPITAVQKEHLGRVRTSGKHLLGLVEDLLSYARVEAHEEILRTETVRLGDIVEDSVVLVRPMADKKELPIHLMRPADAIELRTDSRKLRQILVNLLANAVKFTNYGHVTLRIRAEENDGYNSVRVEITDTGRGMTPMEQLHVFDPFWQADRSSTHSGGSSGLGLSVARQLARLLGGDIAVTISEPGVGTTFALTMPIQAPQQ